MPIFTIPGGPGAYQGANGGKIYAFNAINTGGFTLVAPANPNRIRITFHNPGTNDIFVFPPDASFTPAGVPNPLVPSASTLGGCFRVFGNGGTLVVDGECQGRWQAFSGTGSTNPLTVMDSNVG